MKKSLLNLICCPFCKNSFDLEITQEKNGEIEEGSLFCSCGKVFPIIFGIPRILPDTLPDKKKETAESFAFEWEKFSQMRDEWQKNFDFYFKPVDREDLKNKIALELGCGNGRHTFYAGKIFKELISIDLSRAIDVAKANNKDQNNIHFIQADIYYLPLKEKFFDFVFCLGVLHHLPTPEQGFEKLVNLVKQGGGVLIYVYHKFSKKDPKYYILAPVTLLRKLTTKLSHKILYILCYPIAILSYLIFVLPYKYLFKYFVKEGWPLGTYANYSFFVILNDTFDRFSAPIENRYSKEEILAWYQRSSFKNIKILAGSGWRLFGTK